MPTGPEPDEAEILAGLLAELDTCANGIAYVYDTLATLARWYHLADASIVIEDSALGPQAFRLGRKPATGTDLTAKGAHCRDIVTVPEGAVPRSLREAAGHLCAVALSLQVARHGAGHDPLTRLANRRVFDTALATAAAQSERYGWSFSLVAIDLNHLKLVNDSSGHTAGDDVLRSFGQCLRRSVRAGDTAARIGGDEFAVILGNARKDDVDAFVERLRALARNAPVIAEFTAGTASAPREATSAVELFRLADSRLYDNKAE